MIDKKKVQAIHFTAYKEMALEKAHEIREEIIAKYGLTCAHIYHSLGKSRWVKSASSFSLQLRIVRKPSTPVMKWLIGLRKKFLYGAKKYWKITLTLGKKITISIWLILLIKIIPSEKLWLRLS
jgi:hypothetical protein